MAQARQVPFFNYPKLITEHESEVRAKMEDILARGAFIQQKDLEQFEQNLAQYLNVKHVFGVANGTDGLIMAFRAAGLQPGDEVVLPSHTFVATAASVHWAGGVPVLCDIGADHMADAKAMEKKITAKTKFLCPVQLNGRTCDMDAIEALARQYNLEIIEDAAQALGSKFRGKFAGTFGKAGMFSFYPAKILGCFGDGGAVVTNDDKIADHLRLLRDHGRGASGEIEVWGLNSRLDNLQAGIMDVKFKYYADVVNRRRQIARFYQEGLGRVSQITLPPAPDADTRHFDVYQNYEIEVERRDELKDFLAKNGVGTIIQWGGKAVHQMRGLNFNTSLPNTEKMTARFLMLPMNLFISDDDVAYVIQKIHEFYGLK